MQRESNSVEQEKYDKRNDEKCIYANIKRNIKRNMIKNANMRNMIKKMHPSLCKHQT